MQLQQIARALWRVVAVAGPGRRRTRGVASPRLVVSAGGIVTRRVGGGREVLLIRSRRGVWGFPKGRVESGESHEVAALREVREEAGVRAVVVSDAGDVGYERLKRGELVRKEVRFFLMDWIEGEPASDGDETTDARWVPEGEVAGMIGSEHQRELWLRVSGRCGDVVSAVGRRSPGEA